MIEFKNNSRPILNSWSIENNHSPPRQGSPINIRFQHDYDPYEILIVVHLLGRKFAGCTKTPASHVGFGWVLS